MNSNDNSAVAGETSRRLFVYNGGFLTQPRIKRILQLSGYDVRLGLPDEEDMVGVWGQSPTSPRGEKVAARKDTPILRVEDAFLRSVLPGREGHPPIGLHLDTRGVHFDPSTKSDLEAILSEEPLDDTALLNRAKAAMDKLQTAHLSKYTCFDPALAAPEPGYVLIIDQTFGDASVKASGADRNTFLEMLFVAREEWPNARIIIKTHPETQNGHRDGHYKDEHLIDNATFVSEPVSPWHLLSGALAVYTVSSQLGFEAILAGHKPVVFGQPFYMGWGLTDDRKPLDRRQRRLTRAQLFAGAMILYPKWYDPYHDQLGTLETALDAHEAETRAWRDDHQGWVGAGMRLWKRGALQTAFGGYRKMRFAERPMPPRKTMVWGSKPSPADRAVRVEDGFLRSNGLGATLVPPMSLVLDDLGIYYDPSSESRLERLINESDTLTEGQRARAVALIGAILSGGLSKYNLSGHALPDLPQGRRILVPGQVEDDASILLGTGEVKTNDGLLRAVRDANPAAVVLYKPHPDVEAGLRPGKVENAGAYADVILDGIAAVDAIELADHVWTMTSTLGFEALLRDTPVTCLGQPFYAGWGLTDDRGLLVERRTARPDIVALVHAVLIDYPRYFDPITRRPCPPEIIVERLTSGAVPPPGRGNRLLSKLQGVFASYAFLWRGGG